jgi:hypothetical protein
MGLDAFDVRASACRYAKRGELGNSAIAVLERQRSGISSDFQRTILFLAYHPPVMHRSRYSLANPAICAPSFFRYAVLSRKEAVRSDSGVLYNIISSRRCMPLIAFGTIRSPEAGMLSNLSSEIHKAAG